MKQYLFFIITALFLLSSTAALGQDEPPIPTLKDPHNTVYVHLYYLQNASYLPEEAAKTIYGNPKNAEELAIQLKQIYDGKGLWVRLIDLPTDSMYVDSLTGKSIYTLFPKELPEIYVQKFGDKWYYSPESVSAISRLHNTIYPFGSSNLIQLIPKSGQIEFLGLRLWQYIGALLLLVFAWLTNKLFTAILRPIVRRILSTRFEEIVPSKELIWKIARMMSLLIIIWLVIRGLPILLLPIEVGAKVVVGLKIIQSVFWILLFLRLVDLAMHYYGKFTEKTESTLDNQLLPILKTTAYTIVIAAGMIQVLTLLEVNITALIAGVSIGGLALALAAQDTVKNLIGSLTIFADQPFQIGDFVTVKGVTGTIEVVGFRSTRIRTTDNSVVSIPNGILVNEVVNNLGLRLYRRFLTSITITYSTPPDSIERFVEGIRDILRAHPLVKQDNFEVHFNNMNASSLDIILSAYLDTRIWSEELKAKQQIFLGVMRLARLLDIDFAFPSTSVYLEKPKENRKEIDEQAVSALLKELEERYKKVDPEAETP